MQAVLRMSSAHPSAWTGSAMRQHREWIESLSTAEIADLDKACRAVIPKGLSWGRFDKADFPLPVMARRLASIARELEEGRGFVLLRGLPVRRYTLEEIKIIYWGIGCHLGRIVPQNVKGVTLEHIEDLQVENLNDPNLRGYVTARGLDAHCDNSDAVVLLCVDRALRGGMSAIASLPAIYNRILATRPDLLELLFEGYRYDLRGEGATGRLDETSEPVPVFSSHAGRVRGWFHRRLILGGAAKAGITLSAAQREALDLVAGLAHDPDLMLEHDLQPGDLQFLNNYTTIHWRTPYEDGGGHKRLLLRMWINSLDRAPRDPVYEQSWIVAGYQAREWARDRPVAALGNRV
ncbi:MAG: TauD/TfdA family dioxygenase [Betaproteobacteria bacterium]|nr:TauD/TfdA family dioxygenase [Betaproteobacteria bacterium]